MAIADWTTARGEKTIMCSIVAILRLVILQTTGAITGYDFCGAGSKIKVGAICDMRATLNIIVDNGVTEGEQWCQCRHF